MKKVKLILIILLTLPAGLWAQTHEESLQQEIAFEQPSGKNVFFLANINGSIKVEAYEGDRIILQARKQVSAKTEDRLQQAISEVGLGVMDRLDTILLFIKHPCHRFGQQQNKWDNHQSELLWGYDWDNCNKKDYYDFKFDFTLKVPVNQNLHISTINKGDISVQGVKGNLVINNINGSIAVEEGAGLTRAHTINGDVDITYSQTPGEHSTYYSLNGDINAIYPKNFGADVSFKSYNGELFTNVDEIVYQPVTMEKTQASGDGIAFKLESRSSIKVRQGGVRLDFETFNGNVYLREN